MSAVLRKPQGPVAMSKGVGEARHRGASMNSGMGDLLRYLPGRFWLHYVCGGGADMTREEAIASMHDTYDRQRGRRRTPSREAFEVYRAKQDSAGWILYVRVRARRSAAAESTP